MIPVPNLDDRTWKDLVDEAVRLIPKYCPEWTNHNPSDPGITLIELFAWLMEMAIYRLNKVTDKNFLAFLDLMGIEPQAPQPARAFIDVYVGAGGKKFPDRVGGNERSRRSEREMRSRLKFETTRIWLSYRIRWSAASRNSMTSSTIARIGFGGRRGDHLRRLWDASALSA
jgi:predicted phage baseplate assembly protein